MLDQHATFHYLRRKIFLLLAALTLFVIGVILSTLLGPEHIRLLDAVWMVEVTRMANPLLISSIFAVVFNTAQSLPHYLGLFLFCEVISTSIKRRWLAVVVPLLFLLITHSLLFLYFPNDFYYSGSAVLLILGIIAVNQIGRELPGIGWKILILFQYLLAIEWLDMVKWLTSFGFGTRRISLRIKQLAEAYGVDSGLSLFSLLLFFVLLLSAGITCLLIRMMKHTEQEKLRVQQVKLKMAQARSGQEVLFLVHDLKTPLTSIRGLNSLVQLRAPDKKVETYSEKIEQSIAHMNSMISEILFEEKRTLVSVHEIIDTVRSTRSGGSLGSFDVDVKGEMPLLYVNKTRIVRTLINLLNNSFESTVDVPNRKVGLLVERSRNEVHFSIFDNGKGISQEHIKKIWDLGFSTKDSAGAGLAFVRQVIEGHQGKLTVRSTEGETVVTVILPKGEAHDENTHCG
ncbi:HAMP domain-containing sensor histidine kinase [Ammoniphilus sp. CFH 90114]|uniref:sensor histidine kinase n=1 Tax=Ammoniphilus sp. CFH 90114 TaxID=2493665 RepID=UPI0013E982AA|nr:HAMP domain-containing sensor histidine kinase [Ammoniphilus sp. CFH 90114]